jgi:hypothetical protein
MGTGAGSLLLFLFLGVAGAAAPAHFGFRVLAHRQHLDRGYPFAPGTEDGGLAYSGWLMRWKHRALADRALDFFGGIAAGSGWLALVGAVGTVALVLRQ